MPPTVRLAAWPALLAVTLIFPGCQEPTNVSESVPNHEPVVAAPSGESSSTAPTPSVIKAIEPPPAEEARPAAPEAGAGAEHAQAASPTTGKLPEDVFQATASPRDETSAADTAIALEPVKFDEFLAKVTANKDVKFTVVDAWATWCGPCRENFPHLVAMHAKYAGRGVGFASLSFDDPTNAKQVNEAREFLKATKAVFPNYLLDEADGVGFEKLDINAIPAVFIYTPDGKLLKKFTLDDPNHQFTYDEVEEAVVALLDGGPTPKSGDAK